MHVYVLVLTVDRGVVVTVVVHDSDVVYLSSSVSLIGYSKVDMLTRCTLHSEGRQSAGV
jgi:hypothetical protein